MDAMGARAFVPSVTNSGQIRSLVVRTFSRTMRRAHWARRLGRGRVARSSVAALRAWGSTAARRARGSIGRPYLMAMAKTPRLVPSFIASGKNPPAGPRSRPGVRAPREVEPELLFDRHDLGV